MKWITLFCLIIGIGFIAVGGCDFVEQNVDIYVPGEDPDNTEDTENQEEAQQ